jgi:hypothetical protein
MAKRIYIALLLLSTTVSTLRNDAKDAGVPPDSVANVKVSQNTSCALE